MATPARVRLDGVEHRRAPRAFFAGSTVDVARALLGGVLLHREEDGITAGRIVEVEAYLPRDDPGSHSFRGETPRNASMFGRAGTAYVYLIYGMHHCVNVVTGDVGSGEAVLLRALEPVAGVERMRARRAVERDRDLCRGPGRLAQALAIDVALDRTDLVRGPLSIWLPTSAREHTIATSTRIGLSKGAELPLRFFVAGSPHVSRNARGLRA